MNDIHNINSYLIILIMLIILFNEYCYNDILSLYIFNIFIIYFWPTKIENVYLNIKHFYRKKILNPFYCYQ